MHELSARPSALRSRIMRAIKSSGTGPERKLLALLDSLRYVVELYADLPGKPDVYLPRHKIAIFVHGCFWHGCPIHYRKPTVNRAFWTHKVLTNKARDKRVVRQLLEMGVTTLTIWEHCVLDLTREDLQGTLDNVRALRAKGAKAYVYS